RVPPSHGGDMLQRAGTLEGLYQVLSGLVRQRGGYADQQDGDERCFGVHPLVVEVLVRQNRISRPDTGRVSGGTH
ncbi:MAG TPA: hypothetical protein PK440_16340, partial [Candidatus Accumulibacter phosphatis]|nr:hypothetical protein [Candidatus Accumulibacter phosphatis]